MSKAGPNTDARACVPYPRLLLQSPPPSTAPLLSALCQSSYANRCLLPYSPSNTLTCTPLPMVKT